jgi:F-type H+-transporting ATPase subunit c
MKKTGLFGRVAVVAVFALTLVSVFGGQIAFAQGEPAAAAAGSDVIHYLGAAIGLGMIVIGAGLGIGRFAAAAAEGIARQPAAASQISGAVSLPLFLLEGVAIIGEVVILLIVLTK